MLYTFLGLVVPELPVQPTEQPDPHGDRRGQAVLQHPRDLRRQLQLLARTHLAPA